MKLNSNVLMALINHH